MAARRRRGTVPRGMSSPAMVPAGGSLSVMEFFLVHLPPRALRMCKMALSSRGCGPGDTWSGDFLNLVPVLCDKTTKDKYCYCLYM